MLQKIIGLAGILIFLLIAWLFSSNKKAVNIKTVTVALFFEFIFATAIFLLPKSRDILLAFSSFFTKIIEAAREGIVFVFGSLGDENIVVIGDIKPLAKFLILSPNEILPSSIE